MNGLQGEKHLLFIVPIVSNWDSLDQPDLPPDISKEVPHFSVGLDNLRHYRRRIDTRRIKRATGL
jgi:hypothetical protein